MTHPAIFGRTELLLGTAMMDVLKATKVAVIGLGGVGSWCAEALGRSGVGELLLVDSDRVAETNVNRQLMATTKTVGDRKADVLAERMRDINPTVKLDVRTTFYSADTAADFALNRFDYVIDAIDSLDSKASLIREVLAIPSVTLFSSMGAARKMDPFQVRATEFRKVEGDGLARALRQKFKKTGGIPKRKFTCVWSPEHRENLGPADFARENGKRVNGTVMHMTALFGLALASLVLTDLEKKAKT